MTTIVRVHVAHTPRSPFVHEDALQAFSDGAVAYADGRITACGSFGWVRDRYPDAVVADGRDAVLLPGFVDCGGSTLAAVLERGESFDARLGALFTLAREESIADVRVAGRSLPLGP